MSWIDASGLEELLNQPERLKENLSSHQLIEILDLQIYRALQPIAISTTIIPEFAAEVIPLLLFDTRRKISTTKFSAERLSGYAFSSIFAQSPKKQLRYLKRMSIERNMLFDLVWRLLDLTRTYRESQIEYIACRDRDIRQVYRSKMGYIERLVGSDNRKLYPAMCLAEYWINSAREYKSMVAEKYRRFAFQQATRDFKKTSLPLVFKDLFTNYLLAIEKAIDKFNSERGVLTSYIAFWFKNAMVNPEFDHQIGNSYSLPASRRRKLQQNEWMDSGIVQQNLAQDLDKHLDAQSVEQMLDHDEKILRLRVAKLSRVSEVRTVMLVSGVPYPLSPEQLQRLKATIPPSSTL